MEAIKLTPKQTKFFKTPKTMAEIMDKLFKGDAFAANNFQNDALTNGLLVLEDMKFKLPN